MGSTSGAATSKNDRYMSKNNNAREYVKRGYQWKFNYWKKKHQQKQQQQKKKKKKGGNKIMDITLKFNE